MDYIIMSEKKAYVSRPMHFVILNDEKGYRVSKEAEALLDESASGTNVYSVKLNDEIIWVSDNEFKKYGMKEEEVW